MLGENIQVFLLCAFVLAKVSSSMQYANILRQKQLNDIIILFLYTDRNMHAFDCEIQSFERSRLYVTE